MKRPMAVSLVLSIVLLLFQYSFAEEISFAERFALAEDRAAALRELIPGSEEYYYYHCLHHQNLQQFEEIEPLLDAWVQRHSVTPRVEEIRNRQALLTYEQSPDASLKHLRQILNLRFDHQRRSRQAPVELPTELDAAEVSDEAFLKRALSRHPNLLGIEDAGLWNVMFRDLKSQERRALLSRLDRPDHPQLSELVIQDLRGGAYFGAYPIHSQLLRAQLDECRKALPELESNTSFVQVYLGRLKPGPDEDVELDAAARQNYLDRLRAFTDGLPVAFNSLKVHVLFQQLEHDRKRGVYDRELFIRYLTFPRNMPYVLRELLRERNAGEPLADLRAGFTPQLPWEPIHSDEPLVRAYLARFFADSNHYDDFGDWIREEYLREVFAETKLLAGLGDVERWLRWLTPTQIQQLRDRVDLEFAPTNKRRFRKDDSVQLELLMKNVSTLIVKVYEIRTANFYRESRREIDTDIQLDGLTPNWEETYRYDSAPIRRESRLFEFPQLTGDGVFVIDFIGNGKSSRVVVRRGALRFVSRVTVAGQLVTVLDEQNQHVRNATLELEGRTFQANERGEILVPLSTQPGEKLVILGRGKFHSLHPFEHQGESYVLRAGFHVDRESLLEGRQATVLVRTSLTLGQLPVSLAVLKDVRMRVTATDQDGTPTSFEIDRFQLNEDRDTAFTIQVPARLAQLEFVLSAEVTPHTQSEDIHLESRDTFHVNGLEVTRSIVSLQLMKSDEGFLVEVRGRSGEPRADLPVRLRFRHPHFRDPWDVTLKSNEQGRIRLGHLEGLQSIQGSLWDEGNRHWSLTSQRHSYPSVLHGLAGQLLEIPSPGLTDEGLTRAAVSLLGMRDSQFVADHFEAMSVEDGAIRLRGLEAGDYDLLLREAGERIHIRLVDGVAAHGHVLGERRHLEARETRPARIAEALVDGDVVRIRLAHVDPFTRVHVVATRFMPEFDLYSQLATIRDSAPAARYITTLPSAYVEGRNIGDEYRYIIERKYQTRFPGNMLTRPGLLLHPWAVQDTKTTDQIVSHGDNFQAEGMPPSLSMITGSTKGSDSRERQATGSLDYLANTSAVVLNLRPDLRGVIELERADLRHRQHIHIVLVHPRSTSYQQLVLNDAPMETLDRRLAKSLESDQHFVQKKQVRRLESGESFTLDDVTSSRFEIYDSRAKLFALYATLVEGENENLSEFHWLMRWHTFEDNVKQEMYSKYACHEVHFFLFHRDEEFFERVVAPYLRQKREKQFLDHWLLGEDLRDYLRTSRYVQLNVVERILLAERIGDRAVIARELEHELALQKPDLSRTARLFEAAIAGGALRRSEIVENLGLARKQAGAAQADFDSLSQLMNQGAKMPGVNGLPDDAYGDMMGAGMGMGGMMGGMGGGMGGMMGDMDGMMGGMMPGMGGAMMAPMGAAASDPFGDRPNGMQGQGARSRNARSYFDRGMAGERQAAQLFRPVDQTREWAETHYYRQRLTDPAAERIRANPFWHDFARHEPGSPFATPHFAEASGNRSEALLALSLFDLPAEASKPDVQFEEGRLTLTAGSPLLVLFEAFQEASAELEASGVLVNQRVYRLSDVRTDNFSEGTGNDEPDLGATNECLVHEVYGCQVVVTNSTSQRQTLDVLVQIPEGSIAVSKGRATSSRQVRVEPFQTHKLEYFFYFPQVGSYAHYPVQIARDERVVAAARPRQLQVVAQLSQENRRSWEFVSQQGSEDDVLRFLHEENLQSVALDDLAWRMTDRDLFQRTLRELIQRRIYAHTLWSYGVLHNDADTIRTYLEMSPEFISRCGPYLESGLVRIDPEERRSYQHLEYRPLVNPRAHPLAGRHEILNDRFAAQYRRLMDILSCRRQLDDQDRMAVVYYLLLQDRVEEGQQHFAGIQPDRIDSRMQYDYFAAYLDFFQLEPTKARAIADRYREHPVASWRQLFTAVLANLDELEGVDTIITDKRDRDQQMTDLAATGPSVELKVEASQITIDHQRVEELVVNFYQMDIELLFSRNPFVQGETGQFSWIQPHHTEIVAVPPSPTQTVLPHPETLRHRNVLIEVLSQGIRRWQPYYASSLRLQVHTDFGQIRVSDATSGQPLPTVYVKVYARLRDGKVIFFKDGYTDLGGRFDYASLSTNQLEQVQRFSLLVLSDEQGAEVRETDPPAR